MKKGLVGVGVAMIVGAVALGWGERAEAYGTVGIDLNLNFDMCKVRWTRWLCDDWSEKRPCWEIRRDLEKEITGYEAMREKLKDCLIANPSTSPSKGGLGNTFIPRGPCEDLLASAWDSAEAISELHREMEEGGCQPLD